MSSNLSNEYGRKSSKAKNSSILSLIMSILMSLLALASIPHAWSGGAPELFMISMLVFAALCFLYASYASHRAMIHYKRASNNWAHIERITRERS